MLGRARLALLCLFVALGTVGCGGATRSAEGAVVSPSEAPPVTPTAGGGVVSARAAYCPAVGGTRWWMVTSMPSSGPREFLIELHPDGGAFIGDPADQTRGNDAWTQVGCHVTVFMNDRFVAYEGELADGRLVGEALNVRGQKWDFVMTQR